MNLIINNTSPPKPQLQPIISEVGNNSTYILEKSLWPGNIKNLYQKPKELYIRGNVFWNVSKNSTDLADITTDQINTQKFICIVGARKCTQYGREVTRRLIRELVPYNVVIVSGLALGIDSEAHNSALTYGIPTIAFPGSGLGSGYIYPRLHSDLAEKIVQSGGALISEYPENTKSQSWMFPMRNRLMAGASSIVIVIEAEKVSGTRTTIDSALALGTNIGAVPGQINSIMSYGTNELIKSGAYVITNGRDIAEIVGAKLKAKDLYIISKESKTKPNINNLEQEIISALSITSCTASALAHTIGIPVTKITQVLTKLCIHGLITLGNDGSYRI